MFEMFQSAGDDQIALMGCAGVLLGSGFLMYVSYFLGPKAREEQERQLTALIRERQQFLETPAVKPAREKAA